MSEFKKPNLTKELMINAIVTELLSVTREEYKLRVYSPNKGLKLPILIKNNSAEILEENEFMQILKIRARKIYEPTCETYKKSDMLFLTYDSAKQLMKTILIHPDMQMRDPIKTFAFKSDPALTFCRISFDLSNEILPCENFERFLQNFTNVEALKMWIGSLFIPESDRSQYLWLYGKGGNGKSTLAKVIASILGTFVRFDHAPNKNDEKNWTFGLLGKRLIVLDDCNNYGFVKTGLFKACTGTGRVRVEQKFGHPHDADLDCKFLFTSNEKPKISGDPSDQRRIIFCTAKNQEKFDFNANFETELKGELPNFISNCVLLFNQHCSDGRPIPIDRTEVLELAEHFNEDVEAWLENYFSYDATSWVTVAKFRLELNKTRLNINNVYAYLEKNGAIRKSKFIDGKAVKIISGLKQITTSIYAGNGSNYATFKDD